MRTLLVIASIAGIALLSACEKTTEQGKERSLNIALHGCASNIFTGDDIRLCFDSVISDSRCPSDVVCVWQGAAIAKFVFTRHSETHVLTLATISMGTYFRRDTTLSGYKIEFLDLSPYPEFHSTTPPVNQIKAKVKITKI